MHFGYNIDVLDGSMNLLPILMAEHFQGPNIARIREVLELQRVARYRQGSAPTISVMSLHREFADDIPNRQWGKTLVDIAGIGVPIAHPFVWIVVKDTFQMSERDVRYILARRKLADLTLPSLAVEETNEWVWIHALLDKFLPTATVVGNAYSSISDDIYCLRAYISYQAQSGCGMWHGQQFFPIERLDYQLISLYDGTFCQDRTVLAKGREVYQSLLSELPSLRIQQHISNIGGMKDTMIRYLDFSSFPITLFELIGEQYYCKSDYTTNFRNFVEPVLRSIYNLGVVLPIINGVRGYHLWQGEWVQPFILRRLYDSTIDRLVGICETGTRLNYSSSFSTDDLNVALIAKTDVGSGDMNFTMSLEPAASGLIHRGFFRNLPPLHLTPNSGFPAGDTTYLYTRTRKELFLSFFTNPLVEVFRYFVVHVRREDLVPIMLGIKFDSISHITWWYGLAGVPERLEDFHSLAACLLAIICNVISMVDEAAGSYLYGRFFPLLDDITLDLYSYYRK